MIKTVIFDFDGTLADTLSKILQLFNKLAEEFSLKKISKEEVEILKGKTTIEIIQSFGISAIKLPFIATRIRKELFNSITSIKMFPGIKKVLNAIKEKGFQLGILTSNSKENVEKFLRFHKVFVFDFIHSEKNLLGKADSLGKLIKTYNFDKSKIIYIGDEVRDIDACKENDVKIISVSWGFNKKNILKASNPDYLIDTPKKILKIVSEN